MPTLPRSIKSYGPGGVTWDTNGAIGNYTVIGPQDIRYEDQQLIEGEGGHYGWPNMRSGTDIGGAFKLASKKVWRDTMGFVHIKGGSNYGNVHYQGNLYPDWPPAYQPDWNTADSYAASAYSRMKPTKPSFKALNAIVELRDLPRMLKLSLEKGGLHTIADYHLALQFGWAPLLKDVRNMVLTQINSQKRLDQLIRDNGRPVRRRIRIVDTSDTTVTKYTQQSGLAPSFVTQFYRKPADFVRTEIRTEKVWASAQFRYWLPPGPREIAWRRKMLARIFGLYPSPSVIWNAIPWTWLADWFGNIGDVIENHESGVASRLAADYFYVMRETQYACNQDMVFYGYDGSNNPVTHSATSHSTNNFKHRLKGDPFGFNTNQASLNSMQLSILGALGLSKVR